MHTPTFSDDVESAYKTVLLMRNNPIARFVREAIAKASLDVAQAAQYLLAVWAEYMFLKGVNILRLCIVCDYAGLLEVPTKKHAHAGHDASKQEWIVSADQASFTTGSRSRFKRRPTPTVDNSEDKVMESPGNLRPKRPKIKQETSKQETIDCYM